MAKSHADIPLTMSLKTPKNRLVINRLYQVLEVKIYVFSCRIDTKRVRLRMKVSIVTVGGKDSILLGSMPRVIWCLA